MSIIGRLSTGCGTDGVGFVRTPRQPKDKKTPFVQYMGQTKHFGVDPSSADAVIKMFNYKPEVINYQSTFILSQQNLCPYVAAFPRRTFQGCVEP